MSASSDSLHVRFAEFELDEANARLLRGGEPVALPPTPFGVLCALARRPGALLTKHALLDTVWGHRFVSDSVLKGAVSDIRTALGDDPRRPRFIETVARRGYRFVGLQAGASPSAPATEAREHTASVVERTVAALPDATSGEFVGRDRELASLVAAWARASAGQRAIAWVAGEPGIGKTALIERFAAGLDDVAAIRGSCVQGPGGGEPYYAVLEALAELGRSDDSVAALLRTVAPTWLLQLPWLCTAEQRDALLRELVGVHPERMLREMGEFLDRYTASRPLLLVTEDLHWADTATIRLLDYVARRRSPARLMWLSSFRLAEVVALDHPLGTLRHELRAQGRCVEVVLDSFDEREVGAFLARCAPAFAADPAFVAALHDRTEGVPLFVESMAREIVSRHGNSTADAIAGLPVPQNLRSLIDQYHARLDAPRRDLLTAAAVYGSPFRAGALSRVLSRDLADVADDCEALAQEQLWIVVVDDARAAPGAARTTFAFRHALYRQALLERASSSARTDLHRRVADALESERSAGAAIPAAEIASHYEQGLAIEAAVRCYAEAARAAIQHLAPAECLALSEHALTLLVPTAPWAATHEITLATLAGVSAFHVHGAGDRSRDAYLRGVSRLADDPDHAMRGLLLHGFGFLLSLRAEYDEALMTAARAEALGDATGDALLVVAAATVQGQVHTLQGRHDAARRALERALPTIESLDAASETRLLGFIADPQVTTRAMLSLPLAHLGLVAQSRAHLDAAQARARTLGQPMAVMIALWFDALFEARFGDAARVAAIAAEMQALVDRFALGQGRTACRWFDGWAKARSGHALEGFLKIREASDENIALGMRSGATENLGYAADALVAAGDLEGAQAQLDEAFALAERSDERIWLPQLRLLEATVARGRGESGRAANAIRAAITESRDQGAAWFELLALADLVEHADPSREEVAALGGVVARLDEATDTREVARARALLAARKHDRPKRDRSLT